MSTKRWQVWHLSSLSVYIGWCSPSTAPRVLEPRTVRCLKASDCSYATFFVLDHFLAAADCVFVTCPFSLPSATLSLSPHTHYTSLWCHSFPTTQSESTWNGSVVFFPPNLLFQLFHVTCLPLSILQGLAYPCPGLSRDLVKHKKKKKL